jgi:predicted permease
MGNLLFDLRYGLRTMLRQPRFTVVAVFTLALGIGATTSIFSIVNTIILEPLDYPESERLVRVFETEPGFERDNLAPADFIDLSDMNSTLEGLAGWCGSDVILIEEGIPRQVDGISVTNNFFTLLGIEAQLGRVFNPDADIPGGERVALISDALWRSSFGSDPAVVGRTLSLSDEPWLVVGILPADFDFAPGVEIWKASRWRVPDPPVSLGPDPEAVRSAEYFNAFGRIRKGATLAQAQAEMSAIAASLAEEYPDTNQDEGIQLELMKETVVGDVRGTLVVFLAAVGFVLLIACANVANLLIVRATGRTQELGVRSALGAGGQRLAWQLISESVVLALMGGALGVLIALWGTDALLALSPEELPRAAAVAINGRVILFTVAISLLTGIVFGLVPSGQVLRGNLHAAIREGGGHASGSRSRNRLRSGLIVTEVALSLLLLVGAGLMLRTFLNLRAVDPGFRTEGVVTANLWIPSTTMNELEDPALHYERIIENIEALPGVRRAAGVLSLPIDPAITGNIGFDIEGRTYEPGDGPVTGYQIATPGFFEVMDIPLVRGRLFTAEDDGSAPYAVVINEAAAAEYWPDEDPIGKRITYDDLGTPDYAWSTIVGVVGNTLFDGLDEAPRGEIYRSYLQAPMAYMTLVVDHARPDEGFIRGLREAVLEVDPRQPLNDVRMIEDVLSTSLTARRSFMLILLIFAGAALLLAAVGLYGVLSYSVASRRNELGIRVALGADSNRIISLILRQAAVLVGGGLLVGLAAALGLTRLLASFIFGVGTTDAVTMIGAVVVLGFIALIAGTVPAVRAARMDPASVLRLE